MEERRKRGGEHDEESVTHACGNSSLPTAAETAARGAKPDEEKGKGKGGMIIWVGGGTEESASMGARGIVRLRGVVPYENGVDLAPLRCKESKILIQNDA